MSKVQWEDESPMMTRIKVMGVGGGGCNAVTDMIAQGFEGVEFYGINADYQALKNSGIPNQLQIGDEITHGLGTGAQPKLGEEAARAAEEMLREAMAGADMVFVTAGLGGGTGTGAAPVVAEIARSMDILTVAIVTKPFTFEGPQRMRRANEGMKNLRGNVDTMITILNDKLMETVGPKTPLTEAFHVVNGVLAQGISAISDLVSKPGLINVDFRDVRTIMGETGGAVMGVGVGRGENRAIEAVKKACHSPLQEKIVIDGARGVLINITGGRDVTMHEINEATGMIYESADPDANIIFGVVIDENMTDELRVTIIATGFSELMESEISAVPRPVPRVQPRHSDLGTTPKPPVIESPTEVATREPDPIPALERKRQREAPQPTAPKIDFDREDNPLKDWDRPKAAEEEAGEAEPAAEEPRAQQDEERHYVLKDSESTPPPPPIPQTPSSSEDEAPESSEGEDPYEIPALARRRKNRFFE